MRGRIPARLMKNRIQIMRIMAVILLFGLASRNAGAAEEKNVLGDNSAKTNAVRIEKQAADFSATTYLTEAAKENIKKTGCLIGFGEAEYSLAIPETGWYELWVESDGACELYVDGKFLVRTFFASGVWEPKQKGTEKTLNLYLIAGNHTLKFSRPGLMGLPYIRRFYLEKAGDITGKVRISLEKDCLVFRKGEEFLINLAAGREEKDNTLEIRIVDPQSKAICKTLKESILSGNGNYTSRLAIPTEKEGTFDIEVKDGQGRYVDRVIQYVVIDTATPPVFAKELKQELVQEIDCSQKEPDYATSPTRVVKAPFGAYRESGNKGGSTYGQNKDFFAYTLNLPTIQEPYLVEVDYPDDDYRTFTIAVVEQLVCPYTPAGGVNSGGIYSFSNQMQQQRIYYYPREKNPRIVFGNEYTVQRAAAAKVRVYRITSGFPSILTGNETRMFGAWQEEPGRDFGNFGLMPVGKEWWNLVPIMERLAQVSNYIGANLYEPTITVYQNMMWPSKYLPGYITTGEDDYFLVGPRTLKDPLNKDLVRMMTLICEKYRMNFLPQVFNNGNRYLHKYLDIRFGGDGALYNAGDDLNVVSISLQDSWKKPWWIVHKTGKSVGTASLNPVYPGVQDWIADVFKELAERYKDSPAFKGVAVRIMGWQFPSWQCFPSIEYGYEDYTVGLFEKETGIKVPVDAADPERFQKRYDWLMANAYQKWVDWRCEKIYAYHNRLTKILTDARPDLKLFLDLEGCSASSYTITEWDRKGWLGLVRETGLDPAKYRANPAIFLNNYKDYPPGGRSFWAGRINGAEVCDMWADFLPSPMGETAKPIKSGTVNGVYFNASSFEGVVARFDQLGMGKGLWLNQETVECAGVVNGAGRHILDRFANSLADGNVIHIIDGSHGHIVGVSQPQYTAEFLAEYLSLPAIGMNRYEKSGDPVALWSGIEKGKLYFYLVNRCDYPVEVEVKLAKKAEIKHLASGKPAAVEDGNTLRVSLKSYQLLAFVADKKVAFTDFAVKVPKQAKEQLRIQLDFAEKLVKDETRGPAILELSPVEFKAAADKLAEAKAAFQQGAYRQTRRLLLSHQMVKLFEAFATYPPNLFYRKTPEKSEGAMLPDSLQEKVVSEDKARVKVIDAGQAEPLLSGEKALTWEGDALSFNIDSPIANRHWLSFGYLAKKPYGRPFFLLDGKEITGQEGPVEETSDWGRKVVLNPVVMRAGKHILQARKNRGQAGLLYLDLPPIYQDITANKWRVIGPFAGTNVSWENVIKQLDVVLDPEKERNFSASYAGYEGKQAAWVKPETMSDYVDLYRITGVFSGVISYAATYIESPEERDAEIKFGVDYWAKVWLNGKEIYSPAQRTKTAPRKGETFIPVRLQKGRNEILVKVHTGSAGNGFWLAISDPGDLRYVD